MNYLKTFSRRGFPFAIWLAIGVLLVQMVAMEFHHHDLFEVDDDCPSCQLAAMHPAPTPSTPMIVRVPVLTFTYYVALEPVLFFPTVIRPYLNPYPQAPPRGFVPGFPPPFNRTFYHSAHRARSYFAD